MDAKFIYILFLSFIASFFTACSSDSPDTDAYDKKRELTFEVSGLSRASVTTDINIPGSKFIVYGDEKNNQIENPEINTVLEKTEVEYSDNVWRYDNPKYLFPKHEHSFVAIFPASIVNSGSSPLYSDSKLSFSYTIPESTGNEVAKEAVADILGATHRRYVEEGDGRPVSLRFNHLMALINFAPAYSDNKIDENGYLLLKKIELTGLNNKATFNILPSPILSNKQTDDRVVEVTDQKGKTKMTIEFGEPIKLMNHGENASLFASDDALILLPQTFSADSDAKVTFSYTLNGDPSVIQGSVSLNNIIWESGRSYRYKFTVDRIGIRIDKCEISPWNEIAGEEITVD